MLVHCKKVHVETIEGKSELPMTEINTIVYAGRLRDKTALLSSSSGGAFTAVSGALLQSDNAVVAAVYNYDNHTTEFQMILDDNQRKAAKGSKYMQSKPGEIYNQAYQWLLENPKKQLLFIGMGCQADGFRKFAEMKEIRDRVYVVDIICHGSPSPKLWKEYAEVIQQKHGKITYLTFKDKRNGWKSPTAYVKASGEEVLIKDYVKIFYNRCALRPSCYECPYATTERKTDMTIGDFWHIEETIPDFYDSDGNSVFLIHTDKGKELWERIKGDLDYRLSNTIECWQANLEKPTSKSEFRDKFWSDYQKKGIEFLMKKYGQDSMKVRIKCKLKHMYLEIFGGGYLGKPAYNSCVPYISSYSYPAFFERSVA